MNPEEAPRISFLLLPAEPGWPAVEINGRRYLDGGTSDPIPVKKALEDGCDRLVVVLTRDRSYQKQPEKLRAAYRDARNAA